MDGKVPQTIVTDHDLHLKETVAAEMPNTKHAFSVQLIDVKFLDWLCRVGPHYDEWKVEFYRIYRLETEEEFELGWRKMVDAFSLHSNAHIASLFELHTFWALPYLRSHFFAGMTTDQTEAGNGFIQQFLRGMTRLSHFLQQAPFSDIRDQPVGHPTMQQKISDIQLKAAAPRVPGRA